MQGPVLKQNPSESFTKQQAGPGRKRSGGVMPFSNGYAETKPGVVAHQYPRMHHSGFVWIMCELEKDDTAVFVQFSVGLYWGAD